MPQPRPRRVLFLCHYNMTRGATAERLFCKRRDLDVRSAGTSPDGLARVNALMLDWAEVIFIMDDHQRRALNGMFPDHRALQRLARLDTPDDFTFLEPELAKCWRNACRGTCSRLRAACDGATCCLHVRPDPRQGGGTCHMRASHVQAARRTWHVARDTRMQTVLS